MTNIFFVTFVVLSVLRNLFGHKVHKGDTKNTMNSRKEKYYQFQSQWIIFCPATGLLKYGMVVPLKLPR